MGLSSDAQTSHLTDCGRRRRLRDLTTTPKFRHPLHLITINITTPRPSHPVFSNSLSSTNSDDHYDRRYFQLQLTRGPSLTRHTPTSHLANMSAEEDLIDYSDEELQTTDAAPAAANGDAKKDAAATGATDAQGSYAGVHSTSFRDFLLKPELLKAITDCGFEHPSMS